MKRTIALTLGVAILLASGILPAGAGGGGGGCAGRATHGTGIGSQAWQNSYGCASGLRKC